jgi:hypothetical protein
MEEAPAQGLDSLHQGSPALVKAIRSRREHLELRSSMPLFVEVGRKGLRGLDDS